MKAKDAFVFIYFFIPPPHHCTCPSTAWGDTGHRLMGTSWQTPGSRVTLRLLWCPHTWLSGVRDEGQPGTADAPGKAGTYLRAAADLALSSCHSLPPGAQRQPLTAGTAAADGAGWRGQFAAPLLLSSSGGSQQKRGASIPHQLDTSGSQHGPWLP